MEQKEERIKELIQKYNIDLKKLEDEQKKLAKNLSLKDSINFELADRVAGIENTFFKNRIISAIVVLSNNELVEQEYFEDKVKFPYIPGFRAYRELPSMMSAFNKLDEKPDLVFIRGHGILHPNCLGIASHFSLLAGVPAVGVADSLVVGQVDNEDIIFNGKVQGKVLKTKEGANPVYVSPGNMISLKTALEMTRKYIREPHKFPEPLRLARKYAREVADELSKTNF